MLSCTKIYFNISFVTEYAYDNKMSKIPKILKITSLFNRVMLTYNHSKKSVKQILSKFIMPNIVTNVSMTSLEKKVLQLDIFTM